MPNDETESIRIQRDGYGITVRPATMKQVLEHINWATGEAIAMARESERFRALAEQAIRVADEAKIGNWSDQAYSATIDELYDLAKTWIREADNYDLRASTYDDCIANLALTIDPAPFDGDEPTRDD